MATNDEIRAKDIVPHKTSFSAGDGFYGDGDSSFFMEADDLLRVTAENALAGNVTEYQASGLNANGLLKEYRIPFKKGDTIFNELSISGTALVWVYLMKSDQGTYVALNGKPKYEVPDDGYDIIRLYTDSHSTAYDVSFKFSVFNVNLSNIENRLTDSEQYARFHGYPTEYQASDLNVNGVLKEYHIPFKKGDTIFNELSISGTALVWVYLMKSDQGTYVALNGKPKYEVPDDGYDTIRIYTYSHSTVYDVSFKFSVFNVNLSDIENRLTNSEQYAYSYNYPIEYQVSGLNVDGLLKEYHIPFKKGDTILIERSVSGTALIWVYLIKSSDPSATQALYGSKYEVPDDGYDTIRIYTYSHSTVYDVSFKFSVFSVNLSYVYNKVDKIVADENSLKMCLPQKLYVVKGLPYNIYASSIMLNDFRNVDIFTQPRTTSNFESDLLQIGKVCRIDNLKNCILRIGFEDFIKRNTGLVYKDLNVVYNDLQSTVAKNVIVIGDSITNRGSGYFAKKAAESINCSITGFGTMSNYGSFYGEGREGWTFADFIGKSNVCGAGVITPMGSGASGTLTTNPFIRIATAEDLTNYPDFCFANTGVNSEQSYSDDSSLGTYYIFDFDYYLNRFNDLQTIDVVSIALGTNDVLQNYQLTDIISYAGFMIQRIKSALPNAKIALIPSPAWCATYSYFSERVVPYIESIKTLADSLNVDVVGLWCFMSRFHSFGLDTNDVDVINTSTDYAPYNDNIHFDSGDGGKYAYLEYGKVLASYILN